MIIIETPAPPTLERLVLVPADAVSRTASEPALNVHTSAGRDATPADLARGGYERLGPEVLRVSAAEWRELKLRAEGREAHGEPGTLAHLRADLRDAVRRAEHAEQLTSELQATIARAFSYIEHTPGVQYLDAEVKKLGERAEKAEGLLIQRETELRLAREDGAAVERQMREARSAADASFVRANRAEMRAEKAEREREEAKELARVLEVERDTLRAELARLTAPGEGEPSFECLRDCWDMAPRADASGSDVFRNGFFALYRLGVAHKLRDAQPAKDRATDEELVAIAETAYEAAGRGRGGCVEAAALAVAARVRQERCLVAQAVAMGVSLEIGPHSKGVDIHVSRPRENADGGEFFEGELVEAGRDDVPPSEASATLARLLGEVSRG